MTAAAPAYRADGRPIERDDFYRIACDPARSVVVEACAGAGKTWMLVSRILRALLDGAQPQEILAITFTRKAAGEMRERLNDWLAEFGSPDASHPARVAALLARGLDQGEAERLAPRLARLQQEVIASGRPVEIRTFHAWFAQLLRAAPLELLDELGLRPDMELIESLADHRPEVFRRFHAGLLREPDLLAEHRQLVAERGRSQARKWFELALERRVELELADAAGVLEASVPAREVTGDAAAHQVGEADDPAAGEPGSDPGETLRQPAWQARLHGLLPLLAAGNATAQTAAQGLRLALDPQADPPTAFRLTWEALFTQQDKPRQNLRKLAIVAELQDDLLGVARRQRQWAAHVEHRRMVRLCRLLLAEYAGYKRARGLADMADLERCGLALLRDSSLAGWVQERLDARIRHLLIDEFQDTSPLQWQALLAWLSGYAGAGGGTSGQRPPGVFIVGDPKQSIYRFRRAEPRVFEAAKRFVAEGLGGRVLACDHTRRNRPAVLDSLNTVFSEATEAAEFTGFRPHTTEVDDDDPAGDRPRVAALPPVPRPPKPSKEDGPLPERSWRDSLTVPRDLPEEVLREQEAAQVAEAILGLVRRLPEAAGAARLAGVAAESAGLAGSAGSAELAGPAGPVVAPSDILVLCRKRESLRLVAEALRRLHLPCTAVEEVELMLTPEAGDLIAVLDVLVSTRHRLSLARVLRSPLFGASDDDLLTLARAAAHDDWWQALMVGDHASPALRRAAGLLRGWREAASRLPPHDLLDRIVHEGDLRARVAATVPPAQRLAAQEAIDAVLGQALVLDGARYATPYNFVRALKRRVVKVAAPDQEGAVRLLTVHGAKGLEARVVFVMDSDPEPKPTETATLLCEWPVESAAPVCCAFVYSESACPPTLEALLAREVEARRREELNGLYVAMTRARERLVFSATEPSRRAGRSWWQRVEPRVPRLSLEPGHAFGAAAGPAAPAVLRTTEPLRRGPPARLPANRPDLSASSPGDDARRLGKAVHRLLEWALAAAAGVPDLPLLARAAAAEFMVDPPDEVLRLGRRILDSADCNRFFRPGAALRWAGNEVAISDGAETLRIDRLVQLDDGGGPVWWVLDYKLAQSPAELPAYRDQLRRYRTLVERAQPGSPVRCAFITGGGAVVEID